MNRESRNLVLLVGDLAEGSLLRQQLELVDVFQFIIKTQKYFESIQSTLPGTFEIADCQKISFGTTTPTVGEFIRTLDRTKADWREAPYIVVYPASLYFKDSKHLDILLQKLISVDLESNLRSEGLSIVKIATNRLITANSTSLLNDLVKPTVTDIKETAVNLSSPIGIWKLSHTQTAARDFNSFIPELPYISKNVKNIQKGRDEYSYLSQLPGSIRAFYPQIGEAKESDGNYSYQIEFLPMLDLSRFFIHGSLDKRGLFEQVLSCISRYLESTPVKKASSSETIQQLNKHFVEKLEARLLDLKQLPSYEKIQQLSLSIFPGGLLKFSELLISDLKTEFSKSQTEELVLSHGDLCFSNILFDRLTSSIKLIDPRGGENSFMPIYYDMAKLSHSILGGYDFIMNDMTDFYFDESLCLTIKRPATFENNFSYREKTFVSWCKQRGLNIRLIRLGEASLFLSMLPLHKDNSARMVAQFCAAVIARRQAKDW